LRRIRVIGGGPAGASAAIAARQECAEVDLFEKSRFPRHKVCGEFLSPEIAEVLDRLGVWGNLEAEHPAVIRRLALYFRSGEKHSNLPETAFGLSRYRFDALLFDEAVRLGARVSREAGETGNGPVVIAHGRKAAVRKGRRVFGFKAHFQGPVDDAVELFFFGGCYVGLNPVENGVTNVCGLGPEDLLMSRGFDIDEVVRSFKPLRERLAPLARSMDWLKVGPLVYGNRFAGDVAEGEYPAGDALQFVDPFTGSGLLSAVTAGRLAGIAAARGTPSRDYIRECRRRLEAPFQVSSLLRTALATGWAERLAAFVPGSWLVHLTRPHRVA
jgi:flavin-dependent dehydrogenase